MSGPDPKGRGKNVEPNSTARSARPQSLSQREALGRTHKAGPGPSEPRPRPTARPAGVHTSEPTAKAAPAPLPAYPGAGGDPGPSSHNCFLAASCFFAPCVCACFLWCFIIGDHVQKWSGSRHKPPCTQLLPTAVGPPFSKQHHLIFFTLSKYVLLCCLVYLISQHHHKCYHL